MGYSLLGNLGSWFAIMLVVLSMVLAVVWIVLPFAVFGIKRRLDEMIVQADAMNKYLRDIRNSLNKGDGSPQIRAER